MDKIDSLNVYCFCTGTTFPNGAANNHRIRMMGKSLQSQGINMQIYVNSEGNKNKLNTTVAGVVENLPFEHLNGSMALGLTKTERFVNFFVRGFFKTYIKIREISRDKNSILYVYSQGSEYNVFVSILAKLYNIPVVQEINEWSGITNLSKKNKYIYEKIMMKWAQGAIIISDSIDVNIKKYYPTRKVKTLKVPILADSKVWDNLTKNDSNSFLWCGLVDGYYKDVDFIIRAFSLVSKKYSNYQLKICGEYKPETKGKIKNLCESVQLSEDRVVLTGFITNEELHSYCQSAKALIAPLWDDQRSSDRFPTKISTFLFSGRPLITCNIGEVGKYLDDMKNAIFYIPGSEYDLSKKMQLLIEQNNLADRIGVEGKLFASNNFDYARHSVKIKNYLIDIKEQHTKAKMLKKYG